MAEHNIPNVNPTGKQQLMSESDRIKRHRELVANAQFQQSLNLALLQYTSGLCRLSDPTNAGANMMKLRGAQEFIHEFIYLGESIPNPSPMVKGSALDHTV